MDPMTRSCEDMERAYQLIKGVGLFALAGMVGLVILMLVLSIVDRYPSRRRAHDTGEPGRP